MVGADGARSAVARALGQPARPTTTVIQAKVSLPSGTDSGLAKVWFVPRETPYSIVHLENMLRLTRAGAIVLPASPGFYHRPKSIEELVDFVVGRILDHVGVKHTMPRWSDKSDQT